MLCEFCNSPHDGKFGSGHFCRKKCASAFSTKDKRAEINAKVSQKAKGRPSTGGFKKGHDPYRKIWTDVDRTKASQVRKAQAAKDWSIVCESIQLNQLTTKWSLRKYLLEHNITCGHSEWNGQPLIQEIHHRDGNNKNHRLNNCEMLCPNCHSQTHNFRNRKRADVV
jgi:hypothetical protein